MTILVWLLGVWIGVSLVVGGSWMLLVDHWRRRAAALDNRVAPGGWACLQTTRLSGRPSQNLPGSAHPPGSVKAREEPGSTLSGAHGSGHEAALGRPRSENASPLKLIP